MSVRPEGDDRGGYYEAAGSFDEDAWQEFTPWRAGDPSTAGEAPTSWAGAGIPTDGPRGPADRAAPIERSDGRGPQRADQGDQAQRGGSWWTEKVAQRYSGGERVAATEAIGGPFMTHVRPGTVGRVVERRETMFNGDRLTVDFGNGYVEKNVAPDQVERKGWL